MNIASHNLAERVLIVAEIGNNHEGNAAVAAEMIRAAAASGADAVKFQTITPERLVSAQETERIAQLQRFYLSPDQFRELAAVAREAGVLFLSTPFDLECVPWLNELVPAWKIASGDNTFYPLLDAVAVTGKPLIVSGGLQTMSEARALCAYLNERTSPLQLAYLHCVVSYPTPDDQAHLRTLEALRELPVTPGYSDHTLGIEACVLAVALGARIIEKHFTLRHDYSAFRDHALSATPEEFAEMVRRIRRAETLLGSATKGSVLAEEANRERVRRSIVAREDLPEGTILQQEHLSWVRPGTGLPPGQEDKLFGRRLRVNRAAGELLLTEHVE